METATTYFDGEGVYVKPRVVVDKGFLKGYFLSSYSARRLKMQTTGNAGGAHNLIASSSCHSFKELIKKDGKRLGSNRTNGTRVEHGNWRLLKRCCWILGRRG